MPVTRQKLIICLVLTLGTAGVFWPLHRYEFVNLDDLAYIVENPHLQTGAALDRVKWAFTTLFHIVNTLLLFIVMARMTRAVWPSALVAALFGWHPLHVAGLTEARVNLARIYEELGEKH